VCCAGAYFGYKRDKIENPTVYNELERDIPPQVWYVHPLLLMLVGGSLPFGAVFIELFFILSAVWLHKVCLQLRTMCLVSSVHCLRLTWMSFVRICRCTTSSGFCSWCS